MASDVRGQLHREPIHHDVAEEEAELERARDERRWMRRRSGVRRRDDDEVESAGELGPAVFAGGNSTF